ncbi:MAG: hypothetical protein Q4G49_04320 [Paracoccus sp. (in: a-proteobacteria)]|nr:hypothetical protein [Paracoccus sp. (in: a-proteobacteria)]
MSEYIVKIGFWLHASDGLSIEAASDAEAIAKAKPAAMRAMEDCAIPAHVEYDRRRQGMIS